MSEDRYGDWIQTWSGKQFWPCSPKAEDVDIWDIAHSLSNLCRYGGHVTKFYSVAEHSIHIAEALRRDGQSLDVIKWGLLHDGTEAYCADVPRPLKPYLQNYDIIESSIEKVIIEKFGLSDKIPEIVQDYDVRITVNEMTLLMPSKIDHLRKNYNWEPVPDVKIKNWTPNVAKTNFLFMYNELFE